MRLQRVTMRCAVVLCVVALAGIAVRKGFAAPTGRRGNGDCLGGR